MRNEKAHFLGALGRQFGNMLTPWLEFAFEVDSWLNLEPVHLKFGQEIENCIELFQRVDVEMRCRSQKP